MTGATAPLADDDCYLALKARDDRFDGSFFTGVTSTGIYCRPVCSVKTPKRENCRFFRHAAQAENACVLAQPLFKRCTSYLNLRIIKTADSQAHRQITDTQGDHHEI